MIYLSPSTYHFLYVNPYRFGCMLNTAKAIGGQQTALKQGAIHLWDNGRFTNAFVEHKWIAALEKHKEFQANCIGAIVPDVPFDAAGTLEEFERYHHIPRMLGYKVALATQDGMQPRDIPWSEIDTLFIGGSHEHKKGPEGQALGLAARDRGKWVHVGRVQSGSKIIRHWWYANSWDGTTLIKDKFQQIESILNGIEYLQNAPGVQPVML